MQICTLTLHLMYNDNSLMHIQIARPSKHRVRHQNHEKRLIIDKVMVKNVIFRGNGGHFGFWPYTFFSWTPGQKFCHFMLR